jgi:hypothetical protein
MDAENGDAHIHQRRIRRIHERLAEARARGLRPFGFEGHERIRGDGRGPFLLGEPLSRDAIEAWEAQSGLRIPKAYRAFLRQVGHGGAGPWYGLRRLAQHRGEVPGAVTLGTQGCSTFMVLPTKGPNAGKVLYVDLEREGAHVVDEPDFLAWYERWLDELLAGHDTERLGYGPRGGAASFLRVIDDPNASLDARAPAVEAFLRLPSIRPVVAARLLPLASDPAPRVRAALCSIALAHRVAFADTVAQSALAPLLDDPHVEVRRRVIAPLLALSPARWGETIAARLDVETVPDVADAAYLALESAGLFTRAMLVTGVRRWCSNFIRFRAMDKITWTPEDAELLAGLLGNPHDMVRCYALGGLRDLAVEERKVHGPEGEIPLARMIGALRAQLDRETGPMQQDFLLRVLGILGGAEAAEAIVPWASARGDDLNHLAAVGALAQIGDERVIPIARAMLAETRCPERSTPSTRWSYSKSIGTLTREALALSPHPVVSALLDRKE